MPVFFGHIHFETFSLTVQKKITTQKDSYKKNREWGYLSLIVTHRFQNAFKVSGWVKRKTLIAIFDPVLALTTDKSG